MEFLLSPGDGTLETTMSGGSSGWENFKDFKCQDHTII